jgi:hypothetical protein
MITIRTMKMTKMMIMMMMTVIMKATMIITKMMTTMTTIKIIHSSIIRNGTAAAERKRFPRRREIGQNENRKGVQSLLQDLMIMITIIFNIQKYQEAKPTSGHLELIRSKKCSTRRRTTKSKNQERSQKKVCKNHWFSLCFKHITKFEAISKHRPLTGQGLQALFDNSPKKINVFLAWFY